VSRRAIHLGTGGGRWLLSAILSVALLVVPAGAGAFSSLDQTPFPPPTPVPPGGSPSPFPTRLFTPPPSSIAPPVRAPAAILEDLDTGQILFEKRPNMRRPIASLTKIMTAMVTLRSAKLSEVAVASARADAAGGSELGLRPGERAAVKDLLYALLLQSSNDAAVALAEHVAGSVEAFVGRMNERAEEMGLRNTRFFSPNGLDDRGYSTARELAAITRAAYAFPSFGRIARTRMWAVPSPAGPARHIQNRNALLWLYEGAIGVKTGFTTPAGHCLVAAARRGDRALMAVVLQDPADVQMFDDAAALMNYGFVGFRRMHVIDQGGALGTLRVQGQPVYAVAGNEVAKLVDTDISGPLQRRIRLQPGLTLPVSAGERIGKVVFTVGAHRIGTVSVLAGQDVAAPRPPPPTGSPGSLPDVARLVGVLVRTALAGLV
jgi:serine-type D-Ala-D-Ala carboxypeptidase (penicillin-binding protein 5/6)